MTITPAIFWNRLLSNISVKLTAYIFCVMQYLYMQYGSTHLHRLLLVLLINSELYHISENCIWCCSMVGAKQNSTYHRATPHPGVGRIQTRKTVHKPTSESYSTHRIRLWRWYDYWSAFVDLSAAYDKVNHRLLIQKFCNTTQDSARVEWYGACCQTEGSTWNWTKSEADGVYRRMAYPREVFSNPPFSTFTRMTNQS